MLRSYNELVVALLVVAEEDKRPAEWMEMDPIDEDWKPVR